MQNLIILFLAGAAGALVKEVVEDNAIVMPKRIDGKLCLGFIGSCIVGGMAGYLVDHNPLMAFMSGYAGLSAITNLTGIKTESKIVSPETTEQIIRRVAHLEGVDPELAVRVAKCESGLKTNARNINSPDSIDRGIFQINSKWHPEVTDEQADDPEWATHFFCKAFKGGNLSWWDCSKKCWDK